MNNERIARLLQFIEEDPHDPFNLYCLATEYKDHKPQKALGYYRQLLSDHPDYLPTYYHAAELLIDMGQQDEAEKILQRGIELAARQGDSLALRELQNLQNNLLFD
ncbi:MAG TPA: tetratricopeptide repeat protein [Flammeovirgaceae bacterium]|nr:tetratricopeptide repeat protein [Flammeovirgaceae bacterium]